MPKLGLYVITAIFVLLRDDSLQQLTIDIGLVRISIFEVIFFISFVVLFISKLLHPKITAIKIKYDYVLLIAITLFILFPVIQLYFIVDNIKSITNIMNLMRPYTFFIFMYYFIGNCLDDKKDVKHFIILFIVICTILAFKNIHYFLSGRSTASVITQEGTESIGGLMVPRQGGTDSLMMMGSIVFCIASIYIKRLNIYSLINFIPQTISMFTVFSRATIIGLIGGVISCSIIIVRFKNIFRMMLLGTLGLSVIFLLGNVFIAQWSQGKINVFQLLRLENIDTTTKRAGSVTERYWEYVKIIEEIKKAPFLGHGLKGSYYYYNYTTGNIIKRDFSHNAYLQVTYNFGVIGLSLFLIILYKIMLNMINVIRSTVDEYLRRVAIGAFSCYLAFLMILNSSPNVHTFRPMLFLGMITGISLAIGKINNMFTSI